MIEKANGNDRFSWWLPLVAAIGGFVLFVPIMIYGIDIVEMFYIFAVVPIVSLILLIFAIVSASRKKLLRSLSILSMLCIYCAVSWLLFKNSHELHTRSRWDLKSREYKAEVLEQQNPSNGEFKHIEWDGWGWGGNDTVEYLVFDPNNSLAIAAANHISGKFSGIPCEVPLVRRLESHWYTVLFYTDETWDNCT